MDLYMTEKLTETEDKNQLEEIVSTLAEVIKASGGEPVEFFFGEGLKTVYSISEVPSKIALRQLLVVLILILSPTPYFPPDQPVLTSQTWLPLSLIHI